MALLGIFWPHFASPWASRVLQGLTHIPDTPVFFSPAVVHLPWRDLQGRETVSANYIWPYLYVFSPLCSDGTRQVATSEGELTASLGGTCLSFLLLQLWGYSSLCDHSLPNMTALFLPVFLLDSTEKGIEPEKSLQPLERPSLLSRMGPPLNSVLVMTTLHCHGEPRLLESLFSDPGTRRRPLFGTSCRMDILTSDPPWS